MPAAERLSPLLLAALGLVGEGATAEELADRFETAEARVADTTAEQLLAEMGRLGLVRIGSGRRYVLTSVGQRRLDEGAALGRGEAERLAELERLRTDLLSTIAHELRTPLTALRTSVSLLQDTERAPDEHQRRTLLSTIERNAERMQRLVGDVLDLTRFRTGMLTLQTRRFDARRLARAALASIRPLTDASRPASGAGHAAGARVGLRRPSPAGAGAGQPGLERAQVLAGWVGIRAARRRPGRGGGLDRQRPRRRHRAGRPGAAVRALLRGSERPRRRTFRRRPLAIAQAHGGRVEVDSVPGHGSTFVLVVPTQGPDVDGEA